MSIRKRILKDGRTVFDVTVYEHKDSDGKRPRRFATFPTLSEARKTESEWKAEILASRTHSGQLKLTTYIYAHYWPTASKRLAATSLDTYEKEIRLRINPYLGKLKLIDIDRASIQALMVDRCETACVARKALGVLKAILNEALSDGFIKQNCACSKFAMPDEGTPRDNGLVLSSFAEIHNLLDIVDANGSICVQRIAYTGLLQGLRPEERYALDWSCFDLRSKTITISEARVSATPKHGGVQDKKPKTKNSARTIPMHRDFYEMLIKTPRGNGAFILGDDGNRISPSTAQKRWRRFLRDNPECPPITIENMRHSFATSYLAAGGRIEVLSRILGHANVSTTIDRYYRPDVNLLRADIDLLAYKSRIVSDEQGLTGVRFSAPPPLII